MAVYTSGLVADFSLTVVRSLVLRQCLNLFYHCLSSSLSTFSSFLFLSGSGRTEANDPIGLQLSTGKDDPQIEGAKKFVHAECQGIWSPTRIKVGETWA